MTSLGPEPGPEREEAIGHTAWEAKDGASWCTEVCVFPALAVANVKPLLGLLAPGPGLGLRTQQRTPGHLQATKLRFGGPSSRHSCSQPIPQPWPPQSPTHHGSPSGTLPPIPLVQTTPSLRQPPTPRPRQPPSLLGPGLGAPKAARNRRSAGLSCHPQQTVIPSHTAGFWFRSVQRFAHGLCPTFQPLTNSEKGAEAPMARRPSR